MKKFHSKKIKWKKRETAFGLHVETIQQQKSYAIPW